MPVAAERRREPKAKARSTLCGERFSRTWQCSTAIQYDLCPSLALYIQFFNEKHFLELGRALRNFHNFGVVIEPGQHSGVFKPFRTQDLDRLATVKASSANGVP